MSAFNVLNAFVECPQCGREAKLRLQFKFGDTWQYEYGVGDKLRWGGNDIGSSGLKQVVLDAVSEGCPNCRFEGDFEIWVSDDVLQEVRLPSGDLDFSRTQESFLVLER